MRVPKAIRAVAEIAWNKGRKAEYMALDFYVVSCNWSLILLGDHHILTRVLASQMLIVVIARGVDVVKNTIQKEESQRDPR